MAGVAEERRHPSAEEGRRKGADGLRIGHLWRGIYLYVDPANQRLWGVRLRRQASPGTRTGCRPEARRETSPLYRQYFELPEHGSAGDQQSGRDQEPSGRGLPSVADCPWQDARVCESVQNRGASASEKGGFQSVRRQSKARNRWLRFNV